MLPPPPLLCGLGPATFLVAAAATNAPPPTFRRPALFVGRAGYGGIEVAEGSYGGTGLVHRSHCGSLFVAVVVVRPYRLPGITMNNLSVQIGHFDGIVIRHGNVPDARGGEVHEDGGANAPRADDEDGGIDHS